MERDAIKIDTRKATKQTIGGIAAMEAATRRLAQAIRLALQAEVGQFDQLYLLETASKSAAKGQQQLSKATKEAAKAAKGNLAVFDELNVLEKKAAASSGSGNKKPAQKPPKEEKPKDELAEAEEKANGFGVLKAAVDALRAAMELLRPAAEWLWKNFLQPLSEWAAQTAVMQLERITQILQGISGWVTDNMDILTVFFGPAKELFLGLMEVVKVCLDGLKALWDEHWAMLGENILLFFDMLLGAVTMNWDLVLQSALAIFENFKTLLINSLGILWQTLQNGFAQSWIAVQKVWQSAVEWFRKIVIDPLSQVFGAYWDNMVLAADLAWNSIKGILGPVAKWVNDVVLQPVWNCFLEGLKVLTDGFVTGLDLIWNSTKNIVNGIITVVEGGANLIIGMINSLISALNTIQVEIPEWVPEYGGRHFGVSLPYVPKVSVPRLAQGAVIPPNAQFAAILGDQKNGRNLEAPEGLIREIVREESGGQEIVIRFEGSMSQLVRMLKPEIEREQSRQGTSLVLGGVGFC